MFSFANQIRIASVVTCLCLAAGCTNDDSDYFPTQANRRWEYRLWGKSQDQQGHEAAFNGLRLVSATMPEREWSGQQVTPIVDDIDGRKPVMFVRSDDDGAYAVAYQGAADQPIAGLAKPSCILPLPPEVGATCEIRRPETIGALHFEISGTQRTEAVDDTVVVPAGTFRDCVRVRAKLSGKAADASAPAAAGLEAEFIEWYAPGVGLVKRISWQVADPIALGWGTRTAELVRFSR